jgi:hypothetical protein
LRGVMSARHDTTRSKEMRVEEDGRNNKWQARRRTTVGKGGKACYFGSFLPLLVVVAVLQCFGSAIVVRGRIVAVGGRCSVSVVVARRLGYHVDARPFS